jgi:predicted ester cyclase
VLVRGWDLGGNRACWERDAIDRALASGAEDKRGALGVRNSEAIGQQLGHLARGPPLVGFDLLKRDHRAAEVLGELCLGEIQGLAPPPNPVAEGGHLVHGFRALKAFGNKDWIDRNPIPGGPQGIEGAAHFVRVFRSSFSEIQITIDSLMAEDDLVMFRWIANATHTGEFQSLPPTGKRVTFSGITIHRVASNKFAESVGEIDLLGLLQQIGAFPIS